MKKHGLAYLLTVLVFGTGIWLALQAGHRLDHARPAASPAAVVSHAVAGHPSVGQVLADHVREPLSLLLVQLILIVLLARMFGALFTRFGQPSVIGEMVAGIVLGPSVFGTLAPGASHFLFPPDSLGSLRLLSQVGIILFMFVVGMELDLKHVRSKADTAIMVSHISIILPFFLGVLFSLFIYRAYAVANTSFIAFALFMGIAMSITAFPVLARILEDRHLTKTVLGSTALTCAAIGDVTAWSMLAFVVAIVKAGAMTQAVITIVLAAAFMALTFFVIKPALERCVTRRVAEDAAPSKSVMVGILVLVFASALFTEAIGIHALFGAFLTGIVMPQNARFRFHLQDRLENFSSVFLLPLFFAFTGLRTQIGLLDDWNGWMACAGLILLATAGKLGGAMFTARWTGMTWHDSFALGALMNTRGLVELIVLNVGYDLGILSARVFAMAVIMALVTTFMTGPLLSLGNVLSRKRVPVAAMTEA